MSSSAKRPAASGTVSRTSGSDLFATGTRGSSDLNRQNNQVFSNRLPRRITLRTRGYLDRLQAQFGTFHPSLVRYRNGIPLRIVVSQVKQSRRYRLFRQSYVPGPGNPGQSSLYDNRRERPRKTILHQPGDDHYILSAAYRPPIRPYPERHLDTIFLNTEIQVRYTNRDTGSVPGKRRHTGKTTQQQE